MGDEQHGCAGVVHQRGQQVHDLALRDGVERRGGFVGDDEPRRGDQRRGDAYALLLAAGEFMRVFAGHVTAQSDLVQHEGHPVGAFGFAQIVVHAQRQGDLLRRGHHRIERMGRILEYRAHIPASQVGEDMLVGVCATRVPRQPVRAAVFAGQHGGVPHRDLAGRHGLMRQQAEQRFGDHRLAGAGGPYQAHPFAVRDGQVDAPDNRRAADDDAQSTDLNAHHPPPSPPTRRLRARRGRPRPIAAARGWTPGRWRRATRRRTGSARPPPG